MKRLLPVAGAATAAALLLTGCGSGGGDPSSGATHEKVTVGISQFVAHPALDAARKGFVQALADGGYTEGENLTLDVRNASGDQATATGIASDFASGQEDLVLGIATPAAQSLAQAVTDRPVLFTAVTDPVDAGLVDATDAPGGNITGTTDGNPVADQIDLVKQLKPEAKSVGIIDSSAETNSQVQVAQARKAAQAEGLKVVEKTVTTTAEVAQAADSLDTDALYVPTDNTVVAGLEAVISAAEAKKIPLVAGDGDSVERGALATRALDYTALGRQTGEMAVRILKDGAEPGDLAVAGQKDTRLVVNARAARAMGVEIPQRLRDRADRLIQ
ncbi:ABC transporter substrate-binding protein [Kocuria tytonis]|uniref:ABC transporter substrate-binding protein n=1 Tax=Kocuria tytonis TaxID=2054280 RepID=A0A495AD44_9MICC|nr:ABC transporter substrate-binding protein [Kocuria tytonis]RKQ36675.1 ABC transporter substrate-binding protein [Kocuria tytonis]